MASRAKAKALFLGAVVCGSALVAACDWSSDGKTNPNALLVVAAAETDPVRSENDAADDPAIWVNRRNPSESIILGTDKKAGLAVYSLDGKEVQFLPRGRLNNVDLRQDVYLNGRYLGLAVATNRSENSLDIFSIDSLGRVKFLQAQPLTFPDPHGLCLYRHTNKVSAFVNDKSGMWQQWQISDGYALSLNLVGSFTLDSQPEGCVVDDQTDTLYMGEKERGIWSMPANAARANEKQLLDVVGEGQLVADVEGMDIYRDANLAWLVASSQGDNSYSLYDLDNDGRWLGSIAVADSADGNIDGTSETDGLAVTSAFLGDLYPVGLLVVQDGSNTSGDMGEPLNQNFKLISFAQVRDALTAAAQKN